MKIYKFLQHGEWPVLVSAKNRSKAKYQLYLLARLLSNDGYDGFLDCLKDFKFAGTVSSTEAMGLIDKEECDTDYDVERLIRCYK